MDALRARPCPPSRDRSPTTAAALPGSRPAVPMSMRLPMSAHQASGESGRTARGRTGGRDAGRAVGAGRSAGPLPPGHRPGPGVVDGAGQRGARPPTSGHRPIGRVSSPRSCWPARACGTARRATAPLPRPVPGRAARRRWSGGPFPIPVIDHVGDLAERLGVTVDELDALADTRLRARRAHSPRIANYRYRWLPRPSGARLLEAPKPRLARLQRTILDELLAPIPVHPAAHGFVAGRSAITGAAEHVGATIVIGLDLEHFFAAITAGRIWGVLRAAGYPEPVAHVLTGAHHPRVAGDSAELHAGRPGRGPGFPAPAQAVRAASAAGRTDVAAAGQSGGLFPGPPVGRPMRRRPAPATPVTPTI